MPLHDFRCAEGHITEAWVPQGLDVVGCAYCKGYKSATKVFLKAPQGYVQPDICYDSPIDGRPITTKQARLEDLKRNGCREYETGEKEEMLKQKELEEKSLDRAVEATVEETLAGWSPRKKEILEQEIRAGVTTEIVRKDSNGT